MYRRQNFSAAERGANSNFNSGLAPAPPRHSRRVGLLAFALLSMLPPVCKASANPVPCVKPTNMVVTYGELVSCTITPVGDIDLFQFQGTAGEAISIVATNANGVAVPFPCVALFAPSGAQIGAIACALTSSTLNATLTVTGPYMIQVYGNNVALNSVVVAYALTVQRVSAPPSPTAKSIGFNQNVSDAIQNVGEQDIYTFSATAGAVVQITASNANGAAVPLPCVSLFGPSGAP
jgi:hypothetical protein